MRLEIKECISILPVQWLLFMLSQKDSLMKSSLRIKEHQCMPRAREVFTHHNKIWVLVLMISMGHQLFMLHQLIIKCPLDMDSLMEEVELLLSMLMVNAIIIILLLQFTSLHNLHQVLISIKEMIKALNILLTLFPVLEWIQVAKNLTVLYTPQCKATSVRVQHIVQLQI